MTMSQMDELPTQRRQADRLQARHTAYDVPQTRFQVPEHKQDACIYAKPNLARHGPSYFPGSVEKTYEAFHPSGSLARNLFDSLA